MILENMQPMPEWHFPLFIGGGRGGGGNGGGQIDLLKMKIEAGGRGAQDYWSTYKFIV